MNANMLLYFAASLMYIILVHCDCSHNNYMGTVSVTLSGVPCWRWDSLPEFFSEYTDSMFPDPTVSGAANYCRNPDNDPDGPWCYRSTDDGYDYCATTACDQTTLPSQPITPQSSISTPTTSPKPAAIHIPSINEGSFKIIQENSAFSTQAVKVASIKSRLQCFLECLKVEEVCKAVTLSENQCYIYDELIINDKIFEIGKSIWKRA